MNESQRAMVAARIANLDRGGDGGVHKSNAPIGAMVIPPVSQDEAATMLNVGKRSVERARTVVDHGPEEIDD